MAFPANCAAHEYWCATRVQFTVALFRDGTKPTSEKPGGGVDECFFLAGRSPDAKRRGLLRAFSFLASACHSLGRNRRIIRGKFDSDTRSARIPCRFSRAPAAVAPGNTVYPPDSSPWVQRAWLIHWVFFCSCCGFAGGGGAGAGRGVDNGGLKLSLPGILVIPLSERISFLTSSRSMDVPLFRWFWWRRRSWLRPSIRIHRGIISFS